MERACVYDSQHRMLSITHTGWFSLVLRQPTCRRGRVISHLRNVKSVARVPLTGRLAESVLSYVSSCYVDQARC